MTLADDRIAVLGLSYFGLPPAVVFGSCRLAVELDIEVGKSLLGNSKEPMLEVDPDGLAESDGQLNDIVYGVGADGHDPSLDIGKRRYEYGLELTEASEPASCGAMSMTVAHKHFSDQRVEGAGARGRSVHVFYDLKYILSAAAAGRRL